MQSKNKPNTKVKMVAMITFSCVIGIAIVSVLFVMSKDSLHHRNNFHRIYPPHPIHKIGSLDLQYNSYYFAGGIGDSLFFANSTAPLHLLATNASLSDTAHLKIAVEGIDNLQITPYLKARIDSPYIYLTDGQIPTLLRGRMETINVHPFIDHKAFFTHAVPIDSASLVIRTVSSKTNEYVLGKITNNSLPHVTLTHSLLQKQVDGRFCVDGMLHYCHDNDHVVYVYYYRNEFIVSDRHLNLIYRGKTIDTVTQAKIKLAKIPGEKSITLGAPPLTVNKHSAISGHLLLIQSSSLAKNENSDTFKQAAAIDAYDLRSGNYEFSLYLFNFRGNKLTNFWVHNNILIAKHDRYVVLHTLKPKYFNRKESAVLPERFQ